MLNQTAEYALRAVVHLAKQGPNGTMQSGEIAAALDVPTNYLSKIMHQLAYNGILWSRRGRGGGFRLGRPASELTIADVVRPFDNLSRYQTCLLGNPHCSDATACEAHKRWGPLAAQVMEFARQTTIEQLATRASAPAPAA